MKAFTICVFLLLAHQSVLAMSCNDSWYSPSEFSMRDLLDIRTFDSKSNITRPYWRPFTLNASTYRGTWRLGLGLGASETILNITREVGSDPEYSQWFFATVHKHFKDYIIGEDNYFNTERDKISVPLRYLSEKEASEIMKSLKKQITRATQDMFETIPRSLTNRNESEKVEAIRNILAGFMERNGIPPNSKFIERNISLIHRLMVGELTANELLVFHYSIFDKEMTFEARANISERIDLLNESRADVGQTPVLAEGLVESIRDKFLTFAREYYQNFYEKEMRLMAARRTLFEFFSMNYDIRRRNLEERSHTNIVARRKLRLNIQDREIEGKPTFRLSQRLEKLEKEHDKIEFTLKQLIRERTERINTFNASERWAFELINEDSNEMSMNFNPYALENDFIPMNARALVRLGRSDTHVRIKRASLDSSTVSSGVDKQVGFSASILENSNYGTYGDSAAPIESVLGDSEVVGWLRQVGINSVFEITRYQARDYIEKFRFSLDQLNKLLDELNAIGVHVYFDGEWDKSNHRIRKQRLEYYQFRHVPYIKWREGYTPDKTEE